MNLVNKLKVDMVKVREKEADSKSKVSRDGRKKNDRKNPFNFVLARDK